MERMWYVSRNWQVFGPVSDPQLAQWAATGHVLPTDQLNLAGEPNWWPATAIPGLLPVALPMAQPAALPIPLSLDQEPLSLDDDPVPVQPAVPLKILRVTCFACFREVKLEFPVGTPTVACPKCRTALETGETAVPAAGNAFAALESPAEFKARMEQKAAAATGPEADKAAATAAVIRGIFIGMQ